MGVKPRVKGKEIKGSQRVSPRVKVKIRTRVRTMPIAMTMQEKEKGSQDKARAKAKVAKLRKFVMFAISPDTMQRTVGTMFDKSKVQLLVALVNLIGRMSPVFPTNSRRLSPSRHLKLPNITAFESHPVLCCTYLRARFNCV